jgi:hypothetical protein
MSISLKDAGVWKDGAPWVKDGGIWKPTDKAWVKDAGIWKEIYSGGLPPFNLSGTFAAGLEGWSGETIYWVSGGGGFMVVQENSYADYFISKDICGGLSISASIVHQAEYNTAVRRRLLYRIGSGSFVVLQTVNNANTSPATMSGAFENPGDDDITIRVDTNNTGPYVYFNDWSISGV